MEMICVSYIFVVFLPDLTTMQQRIVGVVASSGRENGKKARKPIISESVILNDGSCTSITLLFNSVNRLKTLTAQYHYSFNPFTPKGFPIDE